VPRADLFRGGTGERRSCVDDPRGRGRALPSPDPVGADGVGPIEARRPRRRGEGRVTRALVLVALLATPADTPPAAALAAAIAAGDAHYARRGEGASGDAATPLEIDGALAEYRRALTIDPRSLDARLRLMRALFFRGGFCGDMPALEKQALFDEAKQVAEETVADLDRVLQRKKGRVRLDGAADADAAAEAYVWAAVSWGQWTVFHKVSAAWQGAPGRIRDLASAAMSIDPLTEQAAAYILLGRLHTEAPRIPFVTGWVSREKGIAFLREGHRLTPQNQALTFFLGSALLNLDPKSAEGRTVLEQCAARAPRPDFLAEDVHYARMARERLEAAAH
jgi:hypothetical protein